MDFLEQINRMSQIDSNPIEKSIPVNNTNPNISQGDYIIIDKKYLGKIIMILWNGNGYVVKLFSQDNYLDPILSQYKILDNGDIKGHMVVTRNNIIDIPNPENLLEIIKYTLDNQEIQGLINLKVKNNFNNFITNKLKTLFPTRLEISQPIIPINPIKLSNYKIEDMNEDNYVEYIIKMLNQIFVENHTIIYYEENTALFNLSSNSIDILSEDNINEIIKPTIRIILEKYKQIDMELFYDFKNSLTYRHIILNQDDTINAGKQLIHQIKTNLFKAQSEIEIKDGERLIDELNLFDFIDFRIVNGFIEMVNKSLPEDFRIITEENCPGLDFFSGMYGKPIDYNILSLFVLKNKTPSDIEINQEEVTEAIKIMSIEYLICIQPKVEFLLWVINRLIFCWYADPILYENIYKVKVLINLYRARGIKEFNRDIDVQPVIIIVPKYGKEISRKVMSLLSFYFFPYKRLGLKNSNPTYFNKLDDLMYYTNGSLDIKKYIKFILGKSKNKIFNQDFTQVKPDPMPNDIQFELD